MDIGTLVLKTGLSSPAVRFIRPTLLLFPLKHFPFDEVQDALVEL